MKDCALCRAITLAGERKNPFAITETRASFIALGWYQYFTGYTLVIAKQHVQQLHDLHENRRSFLDDIILVSEAVQLAYEPKHLNILFLGNQVKHLHAHFFPRRGSEADLQKNIWDVPVEVREHKSTVPNKERISDLRAVLQAKLTDVYFRAGRDDLKLALTQQTIYPPQLL